MSKEIEVTSTDLALGDDMLAVMAKMSLSRMSGVEQVFVGTYGNRSSGVAYQNLKSFVPQLANDPNNTGVSILHGTDRPMGNPEPYRLEEEAVEYCIHGDMGNDKCTPSINRAYHSSAYFEQPPADLQSISILSLAATTEVRSLLTRSLEGGIKVNSLVIMGGVLGIQGNTAPHQEANLRHDPISNISVFEIAEKHGIPISLVPLDLTEDEQVLFDSDRLRWLSDELSHRSPKALEYMKSVVSPDSVYGGFYLGRVRHQHEYPWNEFSYTGVPVHDLTAALVEHDLRNDRLIFEYVEKHIQVNEMGEIGIARPYMEPHFDVTIAGAIKDYDKLWDTILECFRQYK